MTESDEKRSERSLFAIEELRTLCNKNGFKYIEDWEIWLKDDRFKYTTYKGINYWLYPRWPFIKGFKIKQSDYYEALRYNTYSWKYEFNTFLLYDIVETTLPWQKENGEFYSLVLCSKNHRFESSNQKEKLERVDSIKIYDIENRCWMRPLTMENEPIIRGFQLEISNGEHENKSKERTDS